MRLPAMIVLMFYLCSCTTVYRNSQCKNDNYSAGSKSPCNVVVEEQHPTYVGGVPWPVWVFLLPVAVIASLAIALEHAPPPAFDPYPMPPMHPGR